LLGHNDEAIMMMLNEMKAVAVNRSNKKWNAVEIRNTIDMEK